MARSLTLALRLDRSADPSLSSQVAGQIRDGVVAGTLPVGGRFKTDDLQGFLDGLEAALPVRIRRASDGLVYVDPRH